jgi:hypothetical protein
MFKTLISRGWYPALITAIAVVGIIYNISINILVPTLVIILCLGLIINIITARKSELERQAVKLTQLTTYFNRRFMGNSSASVFAVIEGLFSLEDPKIWDWARACGMSQRIFDTWSDHFSTRAESDLRARRYSVFLHTHLDELWAINNHYHEYTEQFCEIAEKYDISVETVEHYNRFAAEYNAFVQNFRETITELRNVARTQIEAPSVKLARELPAKR